MGGSRCALRHFGDAAESVLTGSSRCTPICTTSLISYDEFHKLRRLGVKISASVLKQVAHQLLKQASNDTIYGTGPLDPVSMNYMNVLVNSSWIERVSDRSWAHSSSFDRKKYAESRQDK
jgi:hypothetical protein